MSKEASIHVYTILGESADRIAAFPDLRRNCLDQLAVAEDDGEAVWKLF
jgi:hypothetical protein